MVNPQGDGSSTVGTTFDLFANKQTTQCGARQDRGRGFGPGFVGVRLAKLRAEYNPTSVSVMDDTVPHSTDCATSVADSHILAEHGSTCC